RYEGGGVKFTTLQSYACTDRYKLKLSCQGAGDGLRLELHYDRRCYERADAEALLEHYGQLLASATEAPGQAVSRLELLSQRQREQVLRGYNQTRREYEQGGSVVEMIERQAYQRPDAVAVVSRRRQLSYGALEARANQLAAALRRRGVGAEQVVGVLLEREAELVVGLLGVMKAGAAYLPLEGDYPAGRLAWMVRDAGARLLVSSRGMLEQVGAVLDEALQEAASGAALERLYLEELPGLTAAVQAEEETARGDGGGAAAAGMQRLAYVIYTSGSTGRPKGVMISQLALAHYT